MYFLKLKLLTSGFLTTNKIRFSRSYDKSSILSLLKMPKMPKNTKPQNAINDYLTPSVQIQVIGSGAAGVPSSLLLISSNCRYIINCGEGTQKLGNEYRMNLEKVSHIFVTYPSWNNISGLIGICLSIEQAYHSELFIHGINYYEEAISSLIRLIKKKNFKIFYRTCCHYEEFSDGITSFQYVYLYPSTPVSLEDSAVSKHHEEKTFNTESKFDEEIEKEYAFYNKKHGSHKSPNKNNHNKNIVNETDKRDLSLSCIDSSNESEFISGQYSISYIIKTKKTSGALLLDKCLEYGVPPGPLLGDLKRGKDIQLADGKIVKSIDVKRPDLPGAVIIVVDCPSENFLESLLNEQIFRQYQSGEKPAELVVHFSSSQVVKNLKYQEWISHFPKETRHLFLNEDNKLTGSVGIPRQQFKLNFLLPDIFPPLQGVKIPEFPRAENSATENGLVINVDEKINSAPVYSDKMFYKCGSNSFIYGETLCTVFLRPVYKYDYTKCLVLNKDEFLSEMFRNDMKEKIYKSKEELRELDLSLKTNNRIYPKILFLGTGSSKPSKVRNQSGILIFLDENRCVLLDCGENIYNQLVIFYGEQKVSEILRKLHAIFISHLHLDHHLGLITLLKQRKLAFDKLNKSSLEKSNVQATTAQEVHQESKAVFLLAPTPIQKWLKLYCKKFEDISDYFDLIPNTFLMNGSETLTDKVQLCCEKLNLKKITTTPVCHCSNSFGISLIHENGCKVTYSGDTTPCEALIKLGRNSDILIHEATFDDFYHKEAKIKMHSTVTQAIDIGKKMNAKYILLTHFSQRYCYLPMIEKKFRNLNIGIAFDFMEVPYNKLPLLPALLEPLEYIFYEFNEKLKSKMGSYLKRDFDQADISKIENSADNNNEDSAENNYASPAKLLKKG